MALEFLSFDTVPFNEDCEQMGENYNVQRARNEARAMIEQIRRQFGLEPDGVRFSIHSNEHDFGTYLDIRCYYDERNEEASHYAFEVDNKFPEYWDTEAKIELKLSLPV